MGIFSKTWDIAKNTYGFVGDLWKDWTGQTSNEKNIASQYDFAKNSLKWRIDDGKSRGLSALASVGAPGTSYMPSEVGTNAYDTMANLLGQNISRATKQGMTKDEKSLFDLKKQLLQVQIEGQQIDNDKNRLPSAPEKDPMNYGIPGQGSMTTNPSVSEYQQSNMGMAKNISPFHKWTITQDGTLPRLFSKAVEEALENDLPNKTKYYMRFTMDSAWHAGMRIGEMIKKNKNVAYWKIVERNKPNLAGLDKRDIGFNPFTNEYYILPQYIKKYSNHINNPVLGTIPRKMKKSHKSYKPLKMKKSH